MAETQRLRHEEVATIRSWCPRLGAGLKLTSVAALLTTFECEWFTGLGSASFMARRRALEQMYLHGQPDGSAGQGVRTVVGLQARQAPAIEFVQDLLSDGYVGEVLSTTLIGVSVPGDVVVQSNVYMLDGNNGPTC